MVAPPPLSTRGLPLLLLLLLTSCSSLRTHQIHYGGTDTLLRLGQPETALKQVQAHTPPKKDQLLHLLDIGMLQHWSGQHTHSNQTLEHARQQLEKQRTQSLTSIPRRLLINDNATDYTAQHNEEIYLHIFKALNHIALHQPDSAWVEIRQLDQKLIQLQTDYQAAYQNLPHTPTNAPTAHHPLHESALARWLGMLLYRNEGLWDDMRIDQNRLLTAFNQQQQLYPFPPPNLHTFTQPTQPQQTRLTLLAFHGLTPLKEAQTLTVHTEKDLILLANSHTDDLGRSGLTGWNILPWPGINPGLHLKIQLPQLRKRPTQVATIKALINQQDTHTLQSLESLQTITHQTFKQHRPLLYVRTLTRAISKALALYHANEPLTHDMNQGYAALTRLSLGLLLDQTENADLRTARFFPAHASIAEIILPAGTHTLQFQYFAPDGRLLHTDPPRTLHLQPNQLNLQQSAYLN